MGSLIVIFPDVQLGSFKFVIIKEDNNYILIAQDVDYHKNIVDDYSEKTKKTAEVIGGGVIDIIRDKILLKGKSDKYGPITYTPQLTQMIINSLGKYKVKIIPYKNNVEDDIIDIPSSFF
jgi:hypothetical protein